jgi:succinyl-diaminopimelate desuccinylase
VLDLSADAGALTVALVDVESVSGEEGPLADLVEAALRGCSGLTVERDGNVVLARTSLRRPLRVVLAGHLDTVPVADNLPAHTEADVIYGCGSADMKAGLAVMLRLAHLVGSGAVVPEVDLTWVFYDGEEVESARNGLGRIARNRPQLLDADFAVLLEPSNGTVEGGCNGTLRVDVSTHGLTAHSARAWLGRNAIHQAAPILDRLASYQPREVEVEGLVYRESLNAVGIRGGIAGNVIPDLCVVTVNYRFAPSRSVEEAFGHVRELFSGHDVVLTDAAPGARPGLDQPAAQAFLAVVGEAPLPKYGWTDVSRFSALGVPAVNYGPGDPNLAHKDDEHCPVDQIRRCEQVLRGWLTS